MLTHEQFEINCNTFRVGFHQLLNGLDFDFKKKNIARLVMYPYGLRLKNVTLTDTPVNV